MGIILNSNVKFALINFGIASLYFTLTCIEFVVTRSPNPIGVGLQQWALTVLHGAEVIMYGIIVPMPKKSIIQLAIARIGIALIGLFSIALCASLYALFEQRIWDWLWRLRGQ